MDSLEIEMRGICAFCEHSSHDFPEDEQHEKLHMQGWHACEVIGGFRFEKPLCEHMKIKSGIQYARA